MKLVEHAIEGGSREKRVIKLITKYLNNNFIYTYKRI